MIDAMDVATRTFVASGATGLIRACLDESVRREDAQVAPDGGENERELANLREGDAHGERRPERIAHGPDDQQGHRRLADQDDRQCASHQARRLEERARVAGQTESDVFAVDEGRF